MYQIETRNHYLRIALKNILPRFRNEPDICFIDLASFHSLREIGKCINKRHVSYKYILIADGGIYSRLLSPLVSLESKASIMKYHEVIRHCPEVTYDIVNIYIQHHKNLTGFTGKEITTVYSLLIHDSLESAAAYIGIRPGPFYQRVDKLVKKLNIGNRLQAQYYFRREFCPDTVRFMINEYVRMSFRVSEVHYSPQ